MQTRDSRSQPKGSRQTVNVLHKALDVIEQVVWSRPMTLGELAEASGVEKAAVYRIVNTLIERDYVAQDKASRRFTPGMKLRALGSMAGPELDPVSVVSPLLNDLANEFGETVNFGMLVGSEVHYLKIIESEHPLRMTSSIEDRDPAYATALGKAVLSKLDESVVRNIFEGVAFRKRTNKTVDSVEELIEELRVCHVRGFAIDNEENATGALCVAAAIDAGQGTQYAISVSAPLVRVGVDFPARVGARLTEMAAQVAPRLVIE